jgi:integrase
MAAEWSTIESVPKVKLLRGERHRERVVTPEEEARYLAAAPDLLAAVATVLVDTGMRPEECFRLRWESVTWVNGRNGTLRVTHGKTAAARRLIPMTPRVRHVLETRWEAKGKPTEGWVWPAPTKSGHIESNSLKKQHAGTFRTINAAVKKHNETVLTEAEKQKPVKPWVLYSFRHTFLTRFGESGCDAWTLARIAGHSNISISQRYVHPSENAVLDAFIRLDGHKTGHNALPPK